MDSLFTGGVILRRKFLTFALSLVILCALVFELYPRSSQEIDLSTGAGISKMLRYENAQVYLFGETHRCTEYQQFRNALFQYLVEKKGVRVLLMEHGYASGFLENETVQNRLSFADEYGYDQFVVSKEDYELFQWMSEFNQNRPDRDKIFIVGIDITDSIGMVYAFCRYLLRDCDFSAADTKTQMLLISTQKCQFQQRFENSLLPQLIELYQTNPEQLELALGDQAIHLERVLQGWQQGQECYKLNDYQPDLQLDGPAVAYREDALYANLRRVYEENPTAKYFGSFGAAHVQMENYVQKEGSSRINNSFVSRMAGKNSFLDGRLTVIDGAITHEIGELGEAVSFILQQIGISFLINPSRPQFQLGKKTIINKPRSRKRNVIPTTRSQRIPTVRLMFKRKDRHSHQLITVNQRFTQTDTRVKIIIQKWTGLPVNVPKRTLRVSQIQEGSER